MLRDKFIAVPNKLLGVMMMFGSIGVLFILPWLDTSKVRSARFRPMYRISLIGLVVAMFVLGVVGAHHPVEPYVSLGRIATIYYLLHFLVLVPAFGFIEKPLPLPESISQSVTGGRGGGPLPSGATAKPMEKA